jgi:type IV pilus secretin PilQ/predicted competence protein
MRGKRTIRLIGFVALIWLWSAGGTFAALLETAGSPAIQDFSCRQEGDQTVVILTADAGLDYRTSYPNPRLFLLDIPGAKLRLAQKFYDIRSQQVEFASITRVGEQKELVRIEFNLQQPVHFDIRPDGERLIIRFSSANASVPTPADKIHPAVVPAVTSPSPSSELVKVSDGEQLQFALKTSTRPTIKYFELKNPSRLVIDIDNAIFTNQPQEVAVNTGPVGKVRFGYGTTRPGKIVRCVFDLNQKSNYTIEAKESGLVVLFPRETPLAQHSASTVESIPTPSAAPDNSASSMGANSSSVPVWEETEGAVDSAGTIPVDELFLVGSALPAPLVFSGNPVILPAGEPPIEVDAPVVNLAAGVESSIPSGWTLPSPQLGITVPELPIPDTMVLPLRAETNIGMEQGQASVNLPEPGYSPAPVVNGPAPETKVAGAVQPLMLPAAVKEAPSTTLLPAVGTPPLSATMTALVQDAPPETRIGEGSPDFLMNINLSQLYTPPPILAAPKPQATPPAEPPAEAVAAQPAPPPAKPAAVPMITAGSSAALKYSGEPISLDLKEADIRDFMRLIGNISGLNVVLDPDVKGSLTIFLSDVPWDQALEVVMKNNGLGKQLEGNVLRIATNATLEGEEQQRKRLADARILSAELQTETRTLSYAKAVEMSPILKKILSPRGDIIVDPRTNSMIISDIPGKFPSIDDLIKKLDRKIKQVEIEARVVAATRDFLRDIGVQWGLIQGNYQKNTMAGAIPGDPFKRGTPPSVTMKGGSSGGVDGAMPLLVNLGANAPTSGISFFAGIADNFLLDGMITAAERRGAAKLLSKPKISTQDNIEGFVQQGVKIPVQTTINNTVSVQFFDFALALTVTPQITEEGTIVMKVNITNSTPDFSRQVQGVPTVNTQETRTTVLVENGGTVVIGGVLVDNEQTNVRQVPGFGDLPLVGYLFKNKSVTKQTQELVFFLSPKIM